MSSTIHQAITSYAHSAPDKTATKRAHAVAAALEIILARAGCAPYNSNVNNEMARLGKYADLIEEALKTQP